MKLTCFNAFLTSPWCHNKTRHQPFCWLVG